MLLIIRSTENDLSYSAKMSTSQTDIDGNVDISVQLIAGMIDGKASLSYDDKEYKASNETSFKIYGSLKRTIFATSLSDLNEIILRLKENPDDYLSTVPQENFYLKHLK